MKMTQLSTDIRMGSENEMLSSFKKGRSCHFSKIQTNLEDIALRVKHESCIISNIWNLIKVHRTENGIVFYENWQD